VVKFLHILYFLLLDSGSSPCAVLFVLTAVWRRSLKNNLLCYLVHGKMYVRWSKGKIPKMKALWGLLFLNSKLPTWRVHETSGNIVLTV
jgi:hypothetical protein